MSARLALRRARARKTRKAKRAKRIAIAQARLMDALKWQAEVTYSRWATDGAKAHAERLVAFDKAQLAKALSQRS